MRQYVLNFTKCCTVHATCLRSSQQVASDTAATYHSPLQLRELLSHQIAVKPDSLAYSAHGLSLSCDAANDACISG
jgi:hypothetical protein